MKAAIQNHFRQYHLSERQLQRLRNIQSGFSQSTRPSVLKKVPLRFASVSIIFVLVVGAMLLWIPWNRRTGIVSMASEIAYNHNKQMVMEIESSFLGEVRTHLSKLDFPLIESKRFPSAEWELVGGRYCSLKGHIAAQLRMRNRKTLKTATFYQLPVPREIADPEGTLEVFEQGIKVKVWQERGLLLGAAYEE